MWNIWSNEIFEKAKREEKPILLFIGYTGCYWCEQMERESFVDEKIISLTEEHCIAVRVDSHERPDIGQHFHRVFTQMTGREANYPLTLFLSPELVPLYSASYLPDRSREGMMGLDETIELVAQKYADQRMLLLDKGNEILELLDKKPDTLQATKLHSGIIPLLQEQLVTLYDAEHGGFGEKPKFPRHSVLMLLFDLYEREQGAEIEGMLRQTLDTMCEEALRDATDGGFHRYCTDAAWQHPQRGKTLYDNALMTQVLLRASTLLHEERYATLALETIEFIRNKLMLDGCFCSLYDEEVVRDDSIIISWNAMAIKALFMAGEHDRIYRQMAISSLAKLQEYGMRKGKLTHSFYIGEEPEIEAFLEDYAYLADTLIVAYEQTNEEHYLVKASELINETLRRFFNQGFWLYSDGEFALSAEVTDGDTPAALSVMTGVLYKAAKLIDPAYEKFAVRTVEIHSYELMRQPVSMPEFARVAIQNS